MGLCICVHMYLYLSEDARVCACVDACTFPIHFAHNCGLISLPKWNTVPEAFLYSTTFDGSLMSIKSKFLVLGLGLFFHLTPTHLPPFPHTALATEKWSYLLFSMLICQYPLCTLDGTPWDIKTLFSIVTLSHPHS